MNNEIRDPIWGGSFGVPSGVTSASASTRLVGVPFCPDLLTHGHLGAADNFRGRVIRAFFWLLDRVMPA